ncbi:MAG TPA: hypothetical protein VNN76_02005 [Bacteroidota bacterium]|nr:hypothetical protein [Bacteroidota bacterium]
MDEYLERDFRRICNVHPETHQQWIRLLRVLSGHESAAKRTAWLAGPRWAFAAALLVVVLIGVSLYSIFDFPDTCTTSRGE